MQTSEKTRTSNADAEEKQRATEDDRPHWPLAAASALPLPSSPSSPLSSPSLFPLSITATDVKKTTSWLCLTFAGASRSTARIFSKCDEAAEPDDDDDADAALEADMSLCVVVRVSVRDGGR